MNTFSNQASDASAPPGVINAPADIGVTQLQHVPP